ncbi:MAG: sialate O-acetylesterase, partial [Lentisphaerae bacterium]|nr:sialate O-acetylesterase [Lentisphaerota bacterium]
MILGSLFQDGAVFQRNKMLPVWGETLPGVMVKAEMAGHEVFCRSSKNGEFTVYLPAMAAGG